MAIALKDHELVEVVTSIIVVDYVSYILRESLYLDGTREFWTTKGPWISNCHSTRDELKLDIIQNGPLNGASILEVPQFELEPI